MVAERTALVNQIRGYLAEFGIVVRKGINWARKQLPKILENADNGNPVLAREMFAEMYKELVRLDENIAGIDGRFERLLAQEERCRKLAKLEGVGVMTATAFVATLGEPSVFKNGRQVAAWLGLTPGEHSKETTRDHQTRR